MSGIIHPGGGAPAAAAPAAQPTPQAAPVTPQTAQRMRVGDMTMLHQQPAPAFAPDPAIAQEFEAMNSLAGVDAQAQAIAVEEPAQAEVLEAQIEVDGQPVSYEQYQQLLQKWNQEDLHEELMTKYVTAKINGQRERIPVAEAVSGYMKARDYSNLTTQLAEERREIERTRQGFRNVLGDMDRGDSFLRMVRALGKEQGFQEAAKQYAIEWHREQRMTPEQRELLNRHRELERRAYQLEQRNRQLEQVAQQQQKQAPTQRQAYQQNQLAQMIPIASQRVGLEDSLMARQAFQLHWGQMTATQPEDFEITTDFVVDVMRAAKEEVDAAIQRSNAERARALPKTPPVQRLPGAAPTAQQIQPNGQPKRMRISDMNTVLTRMPGR